MESSPIIVDRQGCLPIPQGSRPIPLEIASVSRDNVPVRLVPRISFASVKE